MQGISYYVGYLRESDNIWCIIYDYWGDGDICGYPFGRSVTPGNAFHVVIRKGLYIRAYISDWSYSPDHWYHTLHEETSRNLNGLFLMTELSKTLYTNCTLPPGRPFYLKHIRRLLNGHAVFT